MAYDPLRYRGTYVRGVRRCRFVEVDSPAVEAPSSPIRFDPASAPAKLR